MSLDEFTSIARERLLAAKIPRGVRDVARTLQSRGFQAVLVGGCVRDCILDRPFGDWDLTTNATPEQVCAAFRKTIPTGIAHGTVTVLPDSDRKMPVEVTTFRGESGYTDGRRPGKVQFLSELSDDLSRRDFTINAMAWDPENEVFSDPFGGLFDLETQTIRAVGDARVRFREDGLRTMRAVRFAAVLEFQLEPETQAAMADAVDVLSVVSRERIRVELEKLLRAKTPSRGLWPMLDAGMWPVVLGASSMPSAEEAKPLFCAIDRLDRNEWLTRLARLLWGVREYPEKWTSALDSLKLSRTERRHLGLLLSPTAVQMHARMAEPIALRQAYVALGHEAAMQVFYLLEAPKDTFDAYFRAIEGCPGSIAELGISATMLQDELGMAPGPKLGEVLRRLHAWAVEDPQRNTKQYLLQRADAILRSESDSTSPQ